MQMAYCGRLGENSRDLVGYLQAVPGMPPLPRGANPATWMLVVTGGCEAATSTVAAAAADFPALYQVRPSA